MPQRDEGSRIRITIELDPNERSRYLDVYGCIGSESYGLLLRTAENDGLSPVEVFRFRLEQWFEPAVRIPLG